MKFWWLPILTTVAIAGCSSTQEVSNSVEPEQQVVTSVDKIKWMDLNLPVDIEANINESSQLLLEGNSAGPIMGLVVDGTRGSLDIEVQTLVENEQSLYASSVKITDNLGNLLAENNFEQFEYQQSKMLDPNKFAVTMNVIPKIGTTKIYILVYTTKQSLDSTSTVTHPAKIFAETKGTVPPVIPDPSIEHSLYGKVKVKVTANDFVTQRVVKAQEYVPEAATSSEYYTSAIQKAVAEDNIPKALSLLDEAKALNIEGAQEVFVKAINNKK
ncbi:MalM family protein [Vibrio nomapromontoriensis]|uniref:MalM family protein n=1 Tax=Vibrio nomapromontoriensis TaxID=2910246 RepID=UPI003D144694